MLATDTLIDSDGLGTVRVHGSDGSALVLTGGERMAGASNVWRSADQRFTYTLIEGADGPQGRGTLHIHGAGIAARVLHFRSGDLGIVLPGAGEAPDGPAVDGVIEGDLQPLEPLQWDELGNVRTTGTPLPGRADTLFDSPEDDRIVAGGGGDLVTAARGGNDHIEAGEGDDLVFDDLGDDVIELGPGRDVGYGGSGGDRIYAGVAGELDSVLAATEAAPPSEDDILDGGEGADWLIGDAGADALFGGAGADLLVGGAGDDTMFGDRATRKTVGIPRVRRLAPAGAAGAPIERRLDFTALEHAVPLEAAADTMLGGAGADWLLGDGGDDYLDGGLGDDYLVGGAGADTLLGADGDDELDGDGSPNAASLSHTSAELHGSDYLDGGRGNDRLIGGGGSDALHGDDGDDSLFGDNADVPAFLHGNDLLDGGRGADTLVGEGGDDQLLGGEGDDVLSGDATDLPGAVHGRDRLDGGEGSDLLFGDGNDDELFGGAGKDILRGDSAELPGEFHGKDLLDGGDGDDLLLGDGGDDRLLGGAGDDVLLGDSEELEARFHGHDVLEGGEGRDELRGNGGNDRLLGGAGDDTLIGGEGDDVLDGGTGQDVLQGGAGNDTYLFERGDGLDTVVENNDPAAALMDVLRFGEGIDASQLWFRRSGRHLDVRVLGTDDRVRIQGWEDGAQHRIAAFELSDGRRLLESDVQRLVEAMAVFSPPPAAQTQLSGPRQELLAPLLAASWQ